MALSLAAMALIGLISNAVGGIAGVGMNHIQRKTDREYNSAEAQKQRDWEEEMSSTSYQRAVEDIEDAGLNPSMLYAGGGQGASTPTGSSASSGGGHMASMNILGQTGQLLNAVTNARTLDYKMNNRKETSTTKQIYNNTGKLIKEIVLSSITE